MHNYTNIINFLSIKVNHMGLYYYNFYYYIILYTIPNKKKETSGLHFKWHEQNQINSLIIWMTINRQHKIQDCDRPSQHQKNGKTAKSTINIKSSSYRTFKRNYLRFQISIWQKFKNFSSETLKKKIHL